MSTSSASGSTATVAADVWMRPGAFGVRHALHAMHAGFELQLGERAAALDLGDDFLVAAEVPSLAETTSTFQPWLAA